MGSTGDAGDITPADAQTPAVGDDEAGVPSPVSDVPAEPSALPSNPQISDFPSADIDEGVYEISSAGSNRVLDVSGGSCDNGANVQQYVLNHTNAQLWDFVARQDGGYFIKSGLGD
ncbi:MULTISPECIES: RICIN domain-containing protein [unclassified Collinsella]|uniref:RICIN domain-containing protein n=1 Tax=unclassified Collinsella TaxID=2637548 RepID=UPI001313E71D|nr:MULTISPECIES: RICIN domain-containing protein [unclassified Collinsella]